MSCDGLSFGDCSCADDGGGGGGGPPGDGNAFGSINGRRVNYFSRVGFFSPSWKVPKTGLYSAVATPPFGGLTFEIFYESRPLDRYGQLQRAVVPVNSGSIQLNAGEIVYCAEIAAGTNYFITG
jgi:hypothetical protein